MHASALTGFARDGAGASAVEFAIVAPLLIVILLAIAAFGMIFGTYHAAQELVSQAARASVAGLTDAERETIVRSYVNANIDQYSFLDRGNLTISSSWSDAGKSVYLVTARYDLSGSIVYTLGELLPLPDPRVRFSAAIQRGGY